MFTRSERIEQIFQRVEEESERRAQEAARRAQPADTAPGRRRGGSISVSRFGQPVDLACAESSLSPGPSSPVPIMSAYVVHKPTFYQVQPHLHMGSVDSLASIQGGDADQDDDNHADEQLTIQIATIAGRQSLSRTVGEMLGRKLSRSRRHSTDVMTSSSSSMVIGVSVEEATVEAEHDSAHHKGTSVAYSSASPAVRHQRSVVIEKSPGTNNWVDKAKDLTLKLRRRSVAALSYS